MAVLLLVKVKLYFVIEAIFRLRQSPDEKFRVRLLLLKRLLVEIANTLIDTRIELLLLLLIRGNQCFDKV